MDPNTRQALAAINQRFYREQAQAFSSSREHSWPGWDRLLHELARTREELAVLDVGCGNGRFARFLTERWPGRFRYLGIDSSEALLSIARSHNPAPERIHFTSTDLVKGPLDERLPGGPFALIALFGVLHHLPSFELRRALICALAERLGPGGSLALSLWRFAAFERFRRRIISWEEYNRGAPDPLDADHLEPGDYLLRFGDGDTAPRYCHFVDEAELQRLLFQLPLDQSACFEADGRTGQYNRYYLLQRGER